MSKDIQITPIKKKVLSFGIVGISPLIQHRWAEKAKQQLRDKHGGKKTKTREVCDPKAEFEAATYFTAEGEYAVPAMALKRAFVTVAHKDVGIEKTLVRKALFLVSDGDQLIRMDSPERTMREDMVRIGNGSVDLRYRPEFATWSVKLKIIFDSRLLQTKDILTLVEWAGFGCGICEMRPEKNGEYGRFELDPSVEIVEEAA